MRRGEIWLADLEPVVGAEMEKERRVVIISVPGASSLPLRLVVPLTEWKDWFAKQPWKVRVEPTPTNHLTKTVAADTLQTRCISTERFNQHAGRLGKLSDREMLLIVEGLKKVIGG
jgi:mRNA interferase MazF